MNKLFISISRKMTTITDNEANNIDPMTEFLNSIGLYHLIHIFNNQEIDMEVFPLLTIADLREIGVTHDNDINEIIDNQYNILQEQYYNITMER